MLRGYFTVALPSGWLQSQQLDDALALQGNTFDDMYTHVDIEFHEDTKATLYVAIKLLAVVNQLDHFGKTVTLTFQGGYSEVMSYLDRVGFFDHLAPGIEVSPGRPYHTKSERYRGRNQGMVEIARIDLGVERDRGLPLRLANALETALAHRTDRQALGKITYTLFAELIDNVFEHSETVLAAYAALQVYPNWKRVEVVVSDSGKGILDTLRPSLAAEYPRYVALADDALLVEILRQGISRHGQRRGCGLKTSAQQALKYEARLYVRLPTCSVQLVPTPGGYTPHAAVRRQNLPFIRGTHLFFDFSLDR